MIVFPHVGVFTHLGSLVIHRKPSGMFEVIHIWEDVCNVERLLIYGKPSHIWEDIRDMESPPM
jgi:hypothetical protein